MTILLRNLVMMRVITLEYLILTVMAILTWFIPTMELGLLHMGQKNQLI